MIYLIPHYMLSYHTPWNINLLKNKNKFGVTKAERRFGMDIWCELRTCNNGVASMFLICGVEIQFLSTTDLISSHVEGLVLFENSHSQCVLMLFFDRLKQMNINLKLVLMKSNCSLCSVDFSTGTQYTYKFNESLLPS